MVKLENLKKIVSADVSGKTAWYYDEENNKYHRINKDAGTHTGTINVNDLPDTLSDAVTAHNKTKLIRMLRDVKAENYDVNAVNSLSRPSKALTALLDHKGTL